MSLRTSLAKFGSFTRTYATARARENFQQKLRAKKDVFQVDNDIPVHIKGGFMDLMLFRFTAVLAYGGSVAGLYTVLGMVFKWN